MSEYVNDPELLAQLNGSVKEKKEDYIEDEAVLAQLNTGDGYIDDPELLKQLNAKSKAEGPVAPGNLITAAVAPVLNTVAQGPTGMKELGQAVKAGASPYVSAAGEGLKKTADIYRARPIMAPLIDAAGVATMGFPPIAAGQQAMGAFDKYNAIKAGAQAAGQVLSQGAPEELLNAAGELKVRPETMKTYSTMQNTLRGTDPAFGKAITEAYGLKTGGGGNNAVRSLLNSAEGQAKMAANPQFAEAATAYLKTVPTYGQQAMKVVSPFLKGAAKIASPVGNAMLGYDMVNQFAENKQQIEANPNAAGLESNPYAMQLRGQAPSVAAAGAMNRQAVLNRPTPQPLSPTEANNLLQSDDERTINIYGGRANLEALVKSGLRQKAASKVLGAVAPQ